MPLGIAAAAVLASLGTMIVSQFMGSSPIGTAKDKTFHSLWPNEPLPEQSAITLRLLGRLPESDYYETMLVLGYNQERARMLANSQRSYLSGNETVVLGRREGKTEEEIATMLVDRGYELTEARRFVKLQKFFPSPMDLINWQAKEVFEPDMIRRYGLGDEFGSLDLSSFAKVGVDEKQALNYWMAHWDHPGWATVQTLLHRGLVTEEDVWEWFRVVEIPPYWRQKMMDASYNPLTRVDVRRMHKLDVLDDEQLHKAYRDVGYNDENAALMVTWTKKYNRTDTEDPDRDLTRAQLERGYRLGLLSLAQLNDALLAMGYDSDKQAFIAASIDEQQRTDEAQDWLTLLKAQTTSGLISVNAAKDKLASLGFSSPSVDHFGELFTAYREQPHKVPSKSDVKTFVQGEMIDAIQAADFMRDLGYRDDIIELYLMTWSGSEERYREWVETMMAVWEEYETRDRLAQSHGVIDEVIKGVHT